MLASGRKSLRDDIQDNGEARNGRPSVHAVWGSSQAINAGLALSCMAKLAVLGGDNPDKVDKVVNTKSGVDDNPQETGKVDSVDKVNILRVLEVAVINLTYGQYLELKLQCRPKVYFEDYLCMVQRKTGELFGEPPARWVIAALDILEKTVISLFYGQYFVLLPGRQAGR